MTKLSDFEAFIFDMDGLVLDTEPAYFEAWRLALEAMGYEADLAFFKSLSGCRFSIIREKLMGYYGEYFDLQNFKYLGAKFWRSHLKKNGVTVKKGVTELLDYAESKNIPVCIATNSPAYNAHECLDLAGIKSRFPLIVTGDQVKEAKPSPDIFLLAASKLGISINRCIVFEDSHPGIVAASSAGAYSVYVPSTFPVDPLTLELCDHHTEDLIQLLQSLT